MQRREIVEQIVISTPFASTFAIYPEKVVILTLIECAFFRKGRTIVVYRPTARVLTVLALLQSHGRMTGAQLARRLEVDTRTARNYIETLIDLGIPVEAEHGRYGAYRLMPGFKLPPLLVSEEEALALALGLKAAR